MKDSFLHNPDSRNAILKRQIIKGCILNGDYSIADLSKELSASVPTISKLVGELIGEGFICDKGKSETNGGRRPVVYGLNRTAGYFAGVDVRSSDISIGLMDFQGNLIYYLDTIPFCLKPTEESIQEMCILIKKKFKEQGFLNESILAYGVNLIGRVNSECGYCFSYFLGEDKPIAAVLESLLDTPVFIDNDSRAMTYGEYICGNCIEKKNMLFINISMGVGMGMIIDGRLTYGKSGFCGEIGHFPLLDNEKICRCGKVGCLETGASGYALQENFIEKLSDGRSSVLSDKFEAGEEISVKDILEAIEKEDILAIECMEEIGLTLGRAIAGLINLFNPELVVIGGLLSSAEQYLMIPIKGSINKYTLTMACKDTEIRLSRSGLKAGILGACLLARSKLLSFY